MRNGKAAGEGGTGEDRDKRWINEDKWKNNEVAEGACRAARF